MHSSTPIEGEARWRAVIAAAVDAIIVIDQMGTLEAFNPAAEHLFGYSAAEVLGGNVSVLMPSPEAEAHGQHLSRYRQTREPHVIGVGRQVTARRRDGSTFPAHLSVGEMSINGEAHFTGILHDLSERVRLEGSLRQESALTQLGEMAAVVAHEVRNPLAGIRGAIQVVGSRLPSGGRDAAVVSEIVDRIDALDHLIGDLLLFARTPVPRLAPLKLGPLLQCIAEATVVGNPSSEISIEVAGQAPPVHADAELLQIVFQNLVANAIHATDGRGPVTLTLRDSGQYLQVLVEDGGPGLSADAAEHLFRPFFTTKSRGTGLGLVTARRLVQLHGGTLDVESFKGRGTRVIVSLPTPASRA